MAISQGAAAARTEPTPASGAAHGSRGYRNIAFALFLAGYSTFSLLYSVQPLLPDLARHYGLGAGTATLAMSASTALLALAIAAAGAISPWVHRRGLMFGSMALGALLTMAAGFAPSWESFLLVRALGGLAFGGVPAIAMTYLAEEIAPGDLGRAMGGYVAGTALGGMAGRLLVGQVATLFSWSGSLIALGVVNFCVALAFLALLPPSRNFTPVRGGGGPHLAAWGSHLRNPRLLRLYAVAFLLTSIFVTLYNYAAFHFAGPPYRMDAGSISLIFLCYAGGIPAARHAGALADRFGRAPAMAGGTALIAIGLLLALVPSFAVEIVGIALATIGFFCAHGVASASVALLGGAARGQASALYLLFYYLGASVTSVALGGLWDRAGWNGILITGVVFAGAALLLLRGLTPLVKE